LIWGIVLADLRPVRIIITLILGALSVGCARVALGRTIRARRQAMQALPAAPRPAHPVLIINPRSGGGKADRFRLADECSARGIEPVLLRPGDDLLQLAKDAIARGADVIGLAGRGGAAGLGGWGAPPPPDPPVGGPLGAREHPPLALGPGRAHAGGGRPAAWDGTPRGGGS